MEIKGGSSWRGLKIKTLVSKVIESTPIGSLASSQFDEWRPNLKFVDLRSTNFKGTLPIKIVILKEKSWAPNSGIEEPEFNGYCYLINPNKHNSRQ